MFLLCVCTVWWLKPNWSAISLLVDPKAKSLIISVSLWDIPFSLSHSFLDKLGVDMNNWTACYPYGSYDDQSIKMLKQRGCKLAVTTEVDIATTSKNTRFIIFK